MGYTIVESIIYIILTLISDESFIGVKIQNGYLFFYYFPKYYKYRDNED